MGRNIKKKNKNNLLNKKDRKAIKKLIPLTDDAKVLRRALVLRALDRGLPKRLLHELEISSDRTAWNIQERYRAGGLDAALYDKERSGKPATLTKQKSQKIAAIACSTPPLGRARWTLNLLCEESQKAGIIKKVSREAVRIILRSHELKPWQKKMWCVPKIDKEYLERMEDVLAVYEKPYDPEKPVVCMDEKPVQLLEHTRQSIPLQSGKPERQDYEYKRNGSVNVFRAVEPKAGRHFTKVTPTRKMPEFAEFLNSIAESYPEAKTIHLVMDNLSSHSEKALTETFGQKEGRRLWNRFTVHYTPKHASWLNQAEIGIGIYARQCLGKERIPTIEDLAARSNAWNRMANRKKIKIDWTFTRKKARRKFGYKTGKD
jgi:transposase